VVDMSGYELESFIAQFLLCLDLKKFLKSLLNIFYSPVPSLLRPEKVFKKPVKYHPTWYSRNHESDNSRWAAF